jgi:sigma-B regulation protein RsbU (phosphoserine phosphatase)
MLTYSNAGHCPPMRISLDRCDRLDVGGRPVGMFDDSAYRDDEVALEPGDQVVLFTDGILEAPAPGTDEEFGEHRLAAAVLARRDLPIGEAIDGILGEVRDWAGGRPPHDDVTLLLLRAR